MTDMSALLVPSKGHGGETEDGELPPNFDKQVNRALYNLRIALNAANADIEKVVK